MAATAATDGGPRSPGARTTTGPPGSTAGGAAGSLAEVLEDLPHLAGEGLDLLQAPDRFRVVAIGVEEQQLRFRENSRQRVGEVVPELVQRVGGGSHHSSERYRSRRWWSRRSRTDCHKFGSAVAQKISAVERSASVSGAPNRMRPRQMPSSLRRTVRRMAMSCPSNRMGGRS